VWDGLGRPAERAHAAALAPLGVRCVHDGDGVDLLAADTAVLVKSPGLRPDVPLVAAAAARGVPVLDEAELGWRLDPRPLVAVTGTNGKSTTVSLVAAVLAAAGRAPVVAGNSRFGVPLSAAAAEPGDAVVAELSSFQLEACPALRPEAAVLTNVTHDHRYRHGSAAAYVAAKRVPFVREPRPPAAVGVDQEPGRALAAELRAAGGTVVTFGADPAADVRVVDVRTVADGSEIDLAGGAPLRVRLRARHNALNVAGALALAAALGLDEGVAREAVAAVAPLPGRFEAVDAGAPFAVVVDFAHNPDGVARAVEAGRGLLGAGGRLHVVLSALSLVGEEQAAAMGAAGAAADRLVLTTQRWTLDDPAGALAPGLEAGARRAGARPLVEPDRAAAIALAVAGAGPGDAVLVLDRGELAGPLYAPDGTATTFDDRAVVRAAVAARG
jgi:UDP-N-acetylmuramoyl-L-alanyl-D-glutamate--2,6-diaminopimelate ligase